MKTSKRLLLLLGFFVVTALVAAVLSIPAILFGYSFFLSFIFWAGVQVAVSYWYDRYVELNIMEDTKAKVLAKPFREYTIVLPCQSCGHNNEVLTDLNNSTFRCTRCKRKNAIHTTFMSTVESDVNFAP